MAAGSPTSTISGVNQTPVAPPIAQNQVYAIDPQQNQAQAGAGAVIPLTDGATIDVPCNQGSYFSVTLGGNRTFNAFAYPSPGQRIVMDIKQDGTGSRTATWNANVDWAAGTAPTITVTAGATDVLQFIYNATLSLWRGSVFAANVS